MGKTADLAMIQKTNIDALHKEGKSQRVITEWMNEWMNEWGIYIALLLCIVVHPKRFTIIWGGLFSTTTSERCGCLQSAVSKHI